MSHFIRLCLLVAAVVSMVPAAQLSYTTSWLANTWGGAGAVEIELLNDMQMQVEAMAVSPDGSVFTSSSWDEAHKEMGIYSGTDNGAVTDHGQWLQAGPGGVWDQDQWSLTMRMEA